MKIALFCFVTFGYCLTKMHDVERMFFLSFCQNRKLPKILIQVEIMFNLFNLINSYYLSGKTLTRVLSKSWDIGAGRRQQAGRQSEHNKPKVVI